MEFAVKTECHGELDSNMFRSFAPSMYSRRKLSVGSESNDGGLFRKRGVSTIERSEGGTYILYHKPLQYRDWGEPEDEQHHASWGSAFYDLLYVAGAFKICTMLSSYLHQGENLSLGLFYFFAMFMNLSGKKILSTTKVDKFIPLPRILKLISVFGIFLLVQWRGSPRSCTSGVSRPLMSFTYL